MTVPRTHSDQQVEFAPHRQQGKNRQRDPKARDQENLPMQSLSDLTLRPWHRGQDDRGGGRLERDPPTEFMPVSILFPKCFENIEVHGLGHDAAAFLVAERSPAVTWPTRRSQSSSHATAR